MTVFLVVALFVISAVVAATVVVRSQKDKFAKANEVVPGSASKAPAEWAGAHSPEARLHRRLRDAVAALRANPAMEDAWMLESRVALEQQALTVDDRLIAVAALPERVRGERMAAVAAAVDAVEEAVAQFVTAPEQPLQRSDVERAMAEVADRVASLEQGGDSV
jgi:hypothetical protein